MPRYALQYERFDDPEWTVETHMVDATDVRLASGLIIFDNDYTGEEFFLPIDRLISAWTNGDDLLDDDEL